CDSSIRVDYPGRRADAPISDVLCAEVRLMAAIRLLDVVALVTDLPERRLARGQVGTVVERLAPGVYEVEFSDDQGRTYAQLPLRREQLMVLRYHPPQAA